MRTRVIALDTTSHKESEHKKGDELSCHSHCYGRPTQPTRETDEDYVRDDQRARQQHARKELAPVWIACDFLGNNTQVKVGAQIQ